MRNRTCEIFKINKMRIALCTIAKSENRYIKEFVSYYKTLGVDVIYLYDNNDTDGECFEDVIGDEIASGFVKLHDYRGRNVVQLDAYRDCYAKYSASADWMMFFDVDEFLTFSPTSNMSSVKEYLGQEKFSSYNMIHINWMCFGDNEKLYYEEGDVTKRFPGPLPYTQCISLDRPENDTVKSILRCGNEVRWIKSVHTPQYVKDVNCCDNKGQKVDDVYSDTLNMDFTEAYLRHYSTKTAEEYALKLVRGFADQHVDMGKMRFLIECRFFATNKKTVQKIEILRKALPALYEDYGMSFIERLLFRGDVSMFGYSDIQRLRIYKLLRLNIFLIGIGAFGMVLCIVVLLWVIF